MPKLRPDRRLCRTCKCYDRSRYGRCTLFQKRVEGHIGGKACWIPRAQPAKRRKAKG